jgi:CheY-like chemotaxis protein
VTSARSVSVLVADDNRDAADTLALLLQLRGYTVRVVYDGPAAVRSALADPPDCVVLDIAMPGQDGYAVARELRAHPATRAIKLVALTGYSEKEIGPRVAAAGFDRHLVKGRTDPEAIEELVQMLEEIKQLAAECKGLLQDARTEFHGATEELRETRQEVREVKEELQEVKEELKEVKEELKDMRRDSTV